MFLGHFALGLGLKRADPRVSLATSFLAAQLADTLWPVLVLIGVEHVAIAPGDTKVTPLRFESYPWSHSLLTLSIMAAVFAALHYAFRRRCRTALLLGALVISHWFLDFISHRPDMALTPWSDVKLGLGLWNSIPATVVVELGLFAAGLALAVTATRPRDRIGHWGFITFMSFLFVSYVGNLLGPPPPSVHALALVSVSIPVVLFPLIAWIDHHREPRGPAT